MVASCQQKKENADDKIAQKSAMEIEITEAGKASDALEALRDRKLKLIGNLVHDSVPVSKNEVRAAIVYFPVRPSFALLLQCTQILFRYQDRLLLVSMSCRLVCSAISSRKRRTAARVCLFPRGRAVMCDWWEDSDFTAASCTVSSLRDPGLAHTHALSTIFSLPCLFTCARVRVSSMQWLFFTQRVMFAS